MHEALRQYARLSCTERQEWARPRRRSPSQGLLFAESGLIRSGGTAAISRFLLAFLLALLQIFASARSHRRNSIDGDSVPLAIRHIGQPFEESLLSRSSVVGADGAKQRLASDRHADTCRIQQDNEVLRCLR